MNSWITSLLAYNNGMIMSGRYMQEPAWTPSELLLQSRLEKDRRSTPEPCSLGGIVQFNESYMDVVDWAYQKVGPPEVFWACLMAGPTLFLGSFYLDTFFGKNPDPFFYNSVATVFCLPFVLWFGRILYSTFTGCTHYPVRLDRKNQMVHVFRHNGPGGISSYPWKGITFGMSGGGARQRGFLKGMMMGYEQRPDGSYDYFRLGVMWPTDEGMRGQWEYFRRYMEEGPGSLPEPEILLPIDGRRESFRMGAQFCWFLAGPTLGPAIFLAPLTVPGSLLRWFIMHVTRRLPRWPQHIIDTCQVSPNDKYAHKPVKPLDVSFGLAFFVTAGVLTLDAALLYWFIGWLSQPGYH